jgi:signal transduction histidine kinase
MPSARTGPARSSRAQSQSALAELLESAARLLTHETTFPVAAPRLAELLRLIPAVGSAELATGPADPAGPGAAEVVEVPDVDGAGRMLVELAPTAPAQDRALACAVLALLRAVRSGGVQPRPRPGMLAAADGVLVATIDAGGRFSADRAMLRHLLGQSEDGTCEEDLRALVHPDDLEAVSRAYESVLATPGGQVELDARVRHTGGHWLVLNISMLNLLGQTGIEAVVLCGHDVTARRVAEQQVRIERARLREIVVQLSGCVAVDDGHTVILANPGFTSTFGAGVTWVGLPRAEFLDRLGQACQDPAGCRDLLAGLAGSGGTHRGVRLALRGSRTVACDVLPIGESHEGPLGTFWYFRDVTAEAVAQNELEEHNRSLAAAAALKSRFVATVSHELRTPLTSILSYGELLADARRSLTASQAGLLDVINRNATRLLRLVDDLLLLSRLETNQLPMSFSEVNLAALVTAAGQELVPTATKRGITLEVAARAGRGLLGDPVRLTQVLDNVIGNALKFTPPGGAVRVTARAEASGWLVTIADTGIGIPDTDLPGLFESFTRASNAAQAGIPGSGLGLTICRQIVELHHGTIRVDSMDGAGTTVEISLPFHESTPAVQA